MAALAAAEPPIVAPIIILKDGSVLGAGQAHTPPPGYERKDEPWRRFIDRPLGGMTPSRPPGSGGFEW